MATLTKEYFDKSFRDLKNHVDARFDKQTKELKAHAVGLQEELARLTNKGFEDVLKRLDFKERVERLENLMYKVVQALDIRV